MNDRKIIIPEAKKVDFKKIDQSKMTDLLDYCSKRFEHIEEEQEAFLSLLADFFHSENESIEDQETNIKQYYTTNKTILDNFEQQLNKLSDMNKQIIEEEEKVKKHCGEFEKQSLDVKIDIEVIVQQLQQNQTNRNTVIQELNGQALMQLANPGKDNLNHEIFNFLFCVVFKQCKNLDDAVEKLNINWQHHQVQASQQKNQKTSFFACNTKKLIPENHTEKKWTAFKDYAFSQDGAIIKQNLKELKSETLTTMQKMVCENLLQDKVLILKSLQDLDTQMAVKLLIDFTENLMQVKNLVQKQTDLEEQNTKILKRLDGVEKIKELKLRLYKFNTDLTAKLKKQIEVVQKIISFFEQKLNMNKDLQKANDKSHNDILLEDQKNKNDIANAEEVVKKQIIEENEKRLMLLAQQAQMKVQQEALDKQNQIIAQNAEQIDIQKKTQEAAEAAAQAAQNPGSPALNPAQNPTTTNVPAADAPAQELEQEHENQAEENADELRYMNSLQEGHEYKAEALDDMEEHYENKQGDDNFLDMDNDTASQVQIKKTLFSKLLENEKKLEQTKQGSKQSYFESVVNNSKKVQGKS